MVEGFVGGLLVAWMLSWFGVDIMITEVIQSMLPKLEITTSHYYVLFGLIGLAGRLLDASKKITM